MNQIYLDWIVFEFAAFSFHFTWTLKFFSDFSNTTQIPPKTGLNFLMKRFNSRSINSQADEFHSCFILCRSFTSSSSNNINNNKDSDIPLARPRSRSPRLTNSEEGAYRSWIEGADPALLTIGNNNNNNILSPPPPEAPPKPTRRTQVCDFHCSRYRFS